MALGWLIGFVVLGVWTVRAVRRAHLEATSRAEVAFAAVLCGALAVMAAVAFGQHIAAQGRARLEKGPLAQARLFVRWVRLELFRPAAQKPFEARIGYTPDAGLLLPRGYGLAEAQRGWDLLRLRMANTMGLEADTVAPPEPTSTRILLADVSTGDTAPQERLSRATAKLIHARRCGAESTPHLDTQGSLAVVLCVGDEPRAGLLVERDLEWKGSSAAVRVAPFLWQDGSWHAHSLPITPGALVQMGAVSDAVPGVTLWELPAPAGRTELFLPVPEVMASCAKSESPCVLPLSPPFGLEIRRLAPSPKAIGMRSLLAAGTIVLPALLALIVFGTRPRSELEPRRFARLMGLSWASAFLGALMVWRLLWAHRLDMLRRFEAAGPLVLQNEAFVALAAAALAATAVLAWPQRPTSPRALVTAGIAWLVFVLAGLWPLLPDARELFTFKLAASAGFSLALGTAAAWWPLLRERWPRLRTAAGLAVALLIVCVGAALLRHELGVLPRIACAWTFVVLFYAGLRHSIDSGRGRATVVAAAIIGGAALLYGDTGVALAVAAPGALFALVLAAHDASYHEDAARTLGGYDRHAPLQRLHALMVIAVAIAVSAWAAATFAHSLRIGEPDGMPARLFTSGALFLPLGAAALTGAVAWSAFRRGERNRAGRWLALSLLLACAWAGRNVLVGRALATHTRAAQRVSLVLDPAYALLSSERDFQRGLAAWNETRLAALDATLVAGEGYFGSRIADAGVRHALDNDYLAVLIARETGLGGLGFAVLAFLVVVTTAAALASERFRDGSGAQRVRLVAALVFGALCVYQPLAALGLLPLTGIAWPGLGLNSPTDFWLLMTLLLAFACWGDRETAPDRPLRAQRGYRRTRRLTRLAQAALALACTLLVLRAGAFALRRPPPLAMADGHERLLAPFEPLSDAVDYVARLHCGAGDPVPREILGDPESGDGLRRFHAAFQREFRAHRDTAARIASTFAAGGACTGADGWTAELTFDECRLGFKFGWPEVHVIVARNRPAQCEIDTRSEPLAALRPSHRAPDAERIRLVSRARGAASGDLGELLAGGVVVRLRPPPSTSHGPPAPLAGATAAPGLYFASEISLSDDLLLVAQKNTVHLVRKSSAPAHDPTWLIVRQAASERVAETDEGNWSMRPLEASTTLPQSGISLIVTGRAHGRTVWLFRPSPDPLLADDVATANGRRFRQYVYGGLLPELGWVNPYEGSQSLGLDGWVHVAALENGAKILAHKPEAEIECGTLRPPEEKYGSVCAPSALDGVLECGVALQPELEIRLRHLLELAAQAPELFPRPQSGRLPRLAQRAEVALLSGESGEIVARADFVPGRESTAYAPRTPEIEHHLVRLREGRDPRTGKKLAHKGEPGALKADWNQRIAVGSTMKPLLAHAFERADPLLVQRLVLSAPNEGATGECEGGWPPLLGHCPPTRSIWDEGQTSADFARYLAQSLNWYQGAVGLLGTAAGGGNFGFGDEGTAQSTNDLSSLPLDLAPRAAALWTRTASGRMVLSATGTVDLEPLRETPLWREFEALVGRPMCTDPNGRACERRSERADLCAARALPIRKPSRDLRHLVALGPSDFDFLPERSGSRVPVSEYFQFLRGSGVHELGSLLQLADAFNRLFYERAPQSNGAYRLAASWFPAKTIGSAPPWQCPDANATRTSRGLCDVLSQPYGTARSIEPLLHDASVVIYGAKTGTIDALRDVAEHRTSCEAWNRAHTIAGAKQQPYQLPCGKASRADINDSLFVIAFGVRAGDKTVPLLLALRFQGVGQGYATAVARPFIDVVREYFSQPPPRGDDSPSRVASKR